MNEPKEEDVKRALECCTTDKITLGVPCRNCPYNECNIVGGKGKRQTSGTCRSWLMKDAYALLREKDAEKIEIITKIERLVRDNIGNLAFDILLADEFDEFKEKYAEGNDAL